MILHNIFSIDEVHNKAIKIERLQNRASPFKSVAKKTWGSIRTQQSFTSSDRPPTHKATGAPTANPVMTAAPATMSKENPNTKPGIGKCYRCDEIGHKSNECPRRRQVNMAYYECEDEVKIDTESEDSDFAEKHGRSPPVWYSGCSATKIPPPLYNDIKYSTQSVWSKNKVCNLIKDNESYKNIVSRALVDYLKLETEPHRHPYTIGGSNKAPQLR